MSSCTSCPFIEVLEPQNHPLYKYTLYKVVYMNVDKEENIKITIYKRYSEFKKLYDQMYTVHLNLHRTTQFPNFVKANYFDRFDGEVIEARRKSAEDILKFICENKHLNNHKYFKDFLNNGVRKTIDHKTSLIDNTLDISSIDGSLPSPLIPVCVLRHQRKSLDEFASERFENVSTIDGFLSKSTSSLEILTDDDGGYLDGSSLLLKDAEKMEFEKKWDMALKNYESLIENLLKGAKLDKNKARVSLVHKKVRSYLDKAEFINKTYVNSKQETNEDELLRMLDNCIVLKSNNNKEVM